MGALPHQAGSAELGQHVAADHGLASSAALDRRSAHPPMTAVAMPLDKLDLWLQGRTGAAATNLAMLDGFVSAVVAGPVSMDPPEWICPLLGIEIDAFNHGGTASSQHEAMVQFRDAWMKFENEQA
jgi:hypothetical protein